MTTSSNNRGDRMTDKPLHHFIDNRYGAVFSTEHPERYDPADRVIPIPAALVGDTTVDAVDWATRQAVWPATGEALAVLRDALIAGRPKPLAEPLDPAVRVLDKDGNEWARLSDGRWVGFLTSRVDWDELTRVNGPLRLAGDSDE